MICRAGAFFEGAPIATSEDSDTYWLYLFNKCSPHEVSFLQLRRRQQVLDLTDDNESSDRVVYSEDRREYEWFPPIVRCEEDMPFPQEVENIFVRKGIRFHGRVATAPHAPVLFEEVMASVPHADPKINLI